MQILQRDMTASWENNMLKLRRMRDTGVQTENEHRVYANYGMVDEEIEGDEFVACHDSFITVSEPVNNDEIFAELASKMSPWILHESPEDLVSQREIAIREGKRLRTHTDTSHYTHIVFLNDANAEQQTFFQLSPTGAFTCSDNMKKGGAVFFKGSEVPHGVTTGSDVRRFVSTWKIPHGKESECMQMLFNRGWYLPRFRVSAADSVNVTAVQTG